MRLVGTGQDSEDEDEDEEAMSGPPGPWFSHLSDGRWSVPWMAEGGFVLWRTLMPPLSKETESTLYAVAYTCFVSLPVARLDSCESFF